MYIQKANIVEILPSGVEVIREKLPSVKIAGYRFNSLTRDFPPKSKGRRFLIKPVDPYEEIIL